MECYEHNWNLEDQNSKRDMDSEGRAHGISEKNKGSILELDSNPLLLHFCCIALLFREHLHVSELKGNAVISLAEGILRQYITKPVMLWDILTAF